MNSSLLEQLKKKLPAQTDRAGLEAVAASTGVPYHTLLKIVKGETEDPRISTVERLLAHYSLGQGAPAAEGRA